MYLLGAYSHYVFCFQRANLLPRRSYQLFGGGLIWHSKFCREDHLCMKKSGEQLGTTVTG